MIAFSAFEPFSSIRVRRALASGLLLCAASAAGVAQARADDAVELLKRMTSYVNGQQNILTAFDSDIEVVTDDLQKIQFASSGQIMLSRPDKLRVTSNGRLCRC